MKKSRRVGILGGGQLAKMICDSAKKMNYKTTILDPNIESCGKLSANKHIIADYNDIKGLNILCENADIITYEFENVPSQTIDYLKNMRKDIPQGKKPLHLSQHRIIKKEAVKKIGVKTHEFRKF